MMMVKKKLMEIHYKMGGLWRIYLSEREFVMHSWKLQVIGHIQDLLKNIPSKQIIGETHVQNNIIIIYSILNWLFGIMKYHPPRPTPHSVRIGAKQIPSFGSWPWKIILLFQRKENSGEPPILLIPLGMFWTEQGLDGLRMICLV